MRGWQKSAATVAMAAGLVSGLGCGGDKATAPATDSATGTWVGTTNGTTITFVLNDKTGELHGTGTIGNGSSVASFVVLSGQWNASVNDVHSLQLTISSSSPTVPVAYNCTTQSANKCDGPATFSDANRVYFTIQR